MRGEDNQQHELFSYGSLEERVPSGHPLRPIRAMVDEALKDLSGRFDEIYNEEGRKSIPPQRLLLARMRNLQAAEHREKRVRKLITPPSGNKNYSELAPSLMSQAAS